MAVYFQLLDKGDMEPVSFSKVDDKMCAHFGVEPDKHNYYQNWYDTIGFGIACGRKWSELREIWDDKLEVIDFLQEYYIPSNWSGR